jgi:ABC-type nickel/cobalt efflux system permease component RcnA
LRRFGWWLGVFAALVAGRALGHDIPNARVDRSTQVTLRPGQVAIDYEVSLSELTLTQELRSLIGHLPGADRAEWFREYGRETGPLNAKGILVSVGGEPVPLRMEGFDLAVEEHPRYTFHFAAEVPEAGRLKVHDTNFASSEGTSRLAVRSEGLAVRGDPLPADVSAIPARPTWQLNDAEEKRTRLVEVDFGLPGASTSEVRPAVPPAAISRRETPREVTSGRLTRLLDRSGGVSLALLGLLAFGLGMVHAIQPGHGKTLVVAATVGDRGGWGRGAVLAAAATVTHTGSIFLVAAFLWWTSSERFGAIHVALTRGSGFVIAAAGAYRLGRHVAGLPEHDRDHATGRPDGVRGLLALGAAGGIVPCWDAVGLVAIAEAVGRLGLGLALVVAFSLGMGLALVAVGWVAARVKRTLTRRWVAPDWERRLGLASGLVLTAMGLYLLGVQS